MRNNTRRNLDGLLRFFVSLSAVLQAAARLRHEAFSSAQALAAGEAKRATKHLIQCDDILASGKRTLLLGLTAPYHGSTSLLQLLMSSQDVSTLCSHGANWQCEGSRIMQEEEGWPTLMGDWNDWHEALGHFSEYWDLTRPVLLEKTPNLMWNVEHSYQLLSKVELPRQMLSAGIKGLELAYIITWRPPCLSALSSHSQENLTSSGAEAWRHDEMTHYRGLVEAHRFLQQQGVPTLVINMGDLLWRQEQTLKRLEQFLPCLRGLDFDFVPELGKDIWEGNGWKLASSIKSYGESTDPVDCCGYDTLKAECLDERKWPPLDPTSHRLEDVEPISYLKSYS
mmetsp:Transcript_50990/g.110639  ORF Transcript_50990/g.110639 Transcript_50990/m.110639 type:complete len:339 (+) Transcript_50990:39-1055(+)